MDNKIKDIRQVYEETIIRKNKEIDNLNQRKKELEELCGPIRLAEEGLTDVEIYNAWCDY